MLAWRSMGKSGQTENFKKSLLLPSSNVGHASNVFWIR